MNDHLARDLALCLLGTAYLRGKFDTVREPERHHPAFASTKDIGFQQMPPGAYTWQDVAMSVTAWFDYLKRSGVTRMALRINSSVPNPAADSGGSVIGAWQGADVDWWQSKNRLVGKPYQSWRDTPQDPRIWAVTYRLIGRNAQAPGNLLYAVTNVGAAKVGLVDAVDALYQITTQQQNSVWAQRFDHAQTAMTEPAPDSPYADELALVDAPADARQLVAAAGRAWCFGTGGTPALYLRADTIGARDEYDAALNALYVAIKNALEAAVEQVAAG